MRNLGMLMWLGGSSLGAYAILIFDTSVSGGLYGSRVVNLELQQRQLMMLIVGAALFVVGAVLQIVSTGRGSSAGETGPSKPIWQAYRDEVRRLGESASSVKPD